MTWTDEELEAQAERIVGLAKGGNASELAAQLAIPLWRAQLVVESYRMFQLDRAGYAGRPKGMSRARWRDQQRAKYGVSATETYEHLPTAPRT